MVYIPIIPNTRKKNPRMRKVFAKSGRDFKMIVTSFLMLGTLLIVLIGLKTLSTLRVFRDGISYSVPMLVKLTIISTRVVITTAKSRKFHQFCRYAFLCL